MNRKLVHETHIIFVKYAKLPAALPIPSSPKTLSGLSASPPCLPGRPRRPCGACPPFLLLPSPAPARLGLIHDRDVFSRFSDEKWAPHAHAPVKGKSCWRGRDGGVPSERRVARAWKAQGPRCSVCYSIHFIHPIWLLKSHR